jgi:uncharacterized protein YjbI with pentapeptide repeats
MKAYKIKSTKDDNILFSGNFSTFLSCIEAAVKDKVNLSHADLSNTNLQNASLDDALLSHANLDGSNLTGANLSEATLNNASFIGAELFNTCFSLSDLRYCNFTGAFFGATDIAGCDISHSLFSRNSCSAVNFTTVHAMDDCLFLDEHNRIEYSSSPPLVIKGLTAQPFILLNHGISLPTYTRMRHIEKT